jgi:hypothetical protein
MKRKAILGAFLSVAFVVTGPPTVMAQERNDAKAAIAAIIALGIGVAIVRHGNDHDLNSDWDQNAYGEPFSPSVGIVCLPGPRQCFENSHFSARWTRRIFGA